MLKVAYLLSHPIQYQSPLLRRLAEEAVLDLTVLYTSDFSVRSYQDEGFGVAVAWDVPLLDGYPHEFLPQWFARWLAAPPLTFLRPLNRGIYARLRHGNFDVLWVHGYATLNSLVAMLAAKALGIPVLLRTDSTLIDHPRSWAKLRIKDIFFTGLRRLVFGVLSVGERNTDYWQHHLGESFDGTLRIYPMPYAVDNDFFAEQAALAAPRREQLRAALQLEPGRAVILFASKLLARKRCIDLVEAYLQYASGLPQELRPYLLLVGEGEERARIETRIAQARTAPGGTDGQSAGDIRLLGFRNQTELPPLYDLCDVFVLPSVHEPWGLVVNEAMNAGRAIIVSDEVGCQPDLVSDLLTEEDNGCVYPAGDVTALAAALERVLGDPAHCRRMGQRSLERIQAYSLEADTCGLMQAFQDAAAWKASQRASHRMELP